MEYVAIRKRATPLVLGALLLVTAAVCGSFAALGWGPRGMFQILAVGCLAALLTLGQRCRASAYRYLLDPWEEIPEHNRLTVVRAVGEKRYPVLQLPLAGLREVIPYCSLRKLIASHGRPSHRLDVCADLFPSRSYWLLFEHGDELTAVRLQCDGAFAEEIRARAGV